jgi:hypothetical protein
MSLISKNMSPEQVAANQANGQKSKGPETEEGKQHSKYARLKYGMYAQSFEETLEALGEDRQEFKALEKDLLDYWKPPNSSRAKMVRRLARLQWLLDRADRSQSAATLHQVETMAQERQWQAQRIDAHFDEMLAALGFLIDVTNRRDFSASDAILKAHQTAYKDSPAPHGKRVFDLLYELVPPSEAPATEGDEDDQDDEEPINQPEDIENQATKATGATEAAPKTPGAPRSAARPTPPDESLCAELRQLLQKDIQDCGEARELLKARVAEPSPAEWNARLAPGKESAMLIRWQESLARQAEQLLGTLSRLRNVDQQAPRSSS